jgi:hypothetical protein
MRAFSLILAVLTGLFSDVPLTTNSAAPANSTEISNPTSIANPTATARAGTHATVVSGMVTDAVSGAPLMGAQIRVDGLTLIALAATTGGIN